MATYRKRGKRWQAQVRLKGHMPLSGSFNSKRDAEQWVRQTEAAVDKGEQLSPRKALRQVTLKMLLERYNSAITPMKKGRVSESYRLKTLLSHPIADKTLDRLTTEAVASYRDDRLKLVSTSSVRRELIILQHCLRLARVDWGIQLPSNPVMGIKKPVEAKARERRVTVEELEALQEALKGTRNPLLVNVIHFAIYTGMRRGEILALEWRHIDRKGRTAHLIDTKNGEPRTVPLSPLAISALPDFTESYSPVFPLSAEALRHAWERLKTRANIKDLRFHDLRHEAISRFFELGLSIPEVSLISGHKDTRMLFRYTHLKPFDISEKLFRLMEPTEK